MAGSRHLEPVLALTSIIGAFWDTKDPILGFNRNHDTETEILVESESSSTQSRVRVIAIFVLFVVNCFPSALPGQKGAVEGEMVSSIVQRLAETGQEASLIFLRNTRTKALRSSEGDQISMRSSWRRHQTGNPQGDALLVSHLVLRLHPTTSYSTSTWNILILMERSPVCRLQFPLLGFSVLHHHLPLY